jgi:hypothetical protein
VSLPRYSNLNALAIFVGAFVLFGTAQSEASDITYSLVNDLLTANQGYGTGSITGTITTDGATGTLAFTDIVSYSLTVTVGSNSSTDTPSNSQLITVFTANLGLSASLTDLTFAYTAYTGGFGTPNIFEIDHLPESSVGFYPATEFFGGNGGGSLHGYTYNNSCFECAAFADYSGSQIIAEVAATPLPAALPLFAGGLGLIGLVGRRKKRQVTAG